MKKEVKANVNELWSLDLYYHRLRFKQYSEISASSPKVLTQNSFGVILNA
jgi:hypothetical protein